MSEAQDQDAEDTERECEDEEAHERESPQLTYDEYHTLVVQHDDTRIHTLYRARLLGHAAAALSGLLGSSCT